MSGLIFFLGLFGSLLGFMTVAGMKIAGAILLSLLLSILILIIIYNNI